MRCVVWSSYSCRDYEKNNVDDEAQSRFTRFRSFAAVLERGKIVKRKKGTNDYRLGKLELRRGNESGVGPSRGCSCKEEGLGWRR